MVFLAVAASGVSQSLFVRSQELMMKKSLGVFLHFFLLQCVSNVRLLYSWIIE